jgi:hypothetical protein
MKSWALNPGCLEIQGLITTLCQLTRASPGTRRCSKRMEMVGREGSTCCLPAQCPFLGEPVPPMPQGPVNSDSSSAPSGERDPGLSQTVLPGLRCWRSREGGSCLLLLPLEGVCNKCFPGEGVGDVSEQATHLPHGGGPPKICKRLC